jgi:hypothetical protein
MHSYSNLVLWPWGHIGTPAPDADALRRLGERMADFNGYFPTQAVGLYYTSGTTDDWSYGELGIASYTFEIGPTSGTCGGFMPPFACLDGEPGGNFWPRNLPALLYAARVSRAPYIEPAGPPLAVERASVVSDTARLTLTLTLDKTRETPTELQAFIGASQQRGSQSVTLHALSAAGQDNQRWRVNLPRSQFEAACDNDDSTCLQQADEQSLPVVLVRGRGAADVWGPLYAVWPQPGTEEETAEPPLRRVWLPLVTVE